MISYNENSGTLIISNDKFTLSIDENNIDYSEINNEMEVYRAVLNIPETIKLIASIINKK